MTMAINRLTPVDFNQRIQIGTVKTVQNPINGTSKQTFVIVSLVYTVHPIHDQLHLRINSQLNN
ncbi:phage head-tail adapter protein [Lactiplantibacillus plantarum]|nr:phage head-tail adapter protein [Lactiplantibacillus plantarum]